jgi:mannosyltransferase OCH1-like enzyme
MFLVLVLVLIFARLLAPLVQRLYHLLRLPFIWHNSSAKAIISQQRDHFDVTFSLFPANYSTEDAGLCPLIPARLHHIYLGPNPPHTEWLAARADCLKQHDSWEAFLWNDSNAPQFVEENYPHLYDMWKSYPFMVQRVDALRYMALQKYGGMLPVKFGYFQPDWWTDDKPGIRCCS